MSSPLLVHIPYSPWSHKARWAIDNAGIPYECMALLPMVNTGLVRLRARKLRGKITAPLWIEGRTVLMDSFAIARHVDRKGSGPSLFPAGAGADVDTWNRQSEKCLAAGRALTTAAVAGDAKALRESVPPPLDGLGPVSTLVGKFGVGYLQKKYGFGPSQREAHEATLRDGLAAVDAALKASRSGYLVGDSLTYADVAMAMVLHFVAPPADLPIGERSRPHWTRPELVAAFPDVLAWRDRILAQRPRSSATPPVE
ncbi:MAG: glutathione S-transferase family protein [Myxococcales bacterium]|nr:glutathione S-transferase family protein [Myxococcales bacterium]MCB9525782.1 glutathione S-transferase family protein [Myxococcales bacterium]